MDIDIAIKGYFDTRDRLKKAWSSPLMLGDIAVKMSTYGSYIGDYLGELKEQYEHNRSVEYLGYLKEGKSSSASENLARSNTADLRGQILKLELVHKNLWSLVSIIQSQLKVLNNEQSSSGLM